MSVQDVTTAAPASVDVAPVTDPTLGIIPSVQTGSQSEPQDISNAQLGFEIKHEPVVAGKVEFEKLIPDAYKAKDYVVNSLKSENPVESILKQLENAQSMIGKQSQNQIPGENATPEQVKAFHKALGAPEDVAGYNLPQQTWNEESKTYGEVLDAGITPEVLDPLKAVALKNGVSAKAFQEMVDAYRQVMLPQVKAQQDAGQNFSVQQDKAFSDQMTSLFGDNAARVADVGRQMLAQYVPDSMKPGLVQLDPKALSYLAVVTNAMHTKLVRGDSVGGKEGMAPSTLPVTAEQRKSAAIPLMQTAAYNDVMHPQHKEMVQKVNTIFGTNQKL